MSNQGLAAWLGEQAKGLVITLIFGTLAAVAIYAVIRKLPKTWWLWGSAVAILFLIFQIAIGPTYLEPVFNKFYPLAESPLKQRILSLARANGIPVEQVYEFDASKQTTKMSAHVSGIAGSAQISLNDNLINRASPEEVEAVIGHEMGHYVLNHEYKARSHWVSSSSSASPSCLGASIGSRSSSASDGDFATPAMSPVCPCWSRCSRSMCSR